MAGKQSKGAQEVGVGMCQENIVDVHPRSGEEREDGFQDVKDSVVREKRAPAPANR